jgi:hypothetical protein
MSSGSGVYYTSSQISEMQSALGQAQSAMAAGNYAQVLSSIQNYYQAQIYVPGTNTIMRGYAQLAEGVAANTGVGVVPNDEVQSAVGSANYTAQFQCPSENILSRWNRL